MVAHGLGGPGHALATDPRRGRPCCSPQAWQSSVHAFLRFVVEGVGTPAPVAPTKHLVVGGLYRYVRNPMYLAVAATIVGQALALGQLVLLVYARGIRASTVYAFVRVVRGAHAAPSNFGEQYEEYRRAVPGWWPRRTPWSAS